MYYLLKQTFAILLAVIEGPNVTPINEKCHLYLFTNEVHNQAY